jgi:hypothetical protein
MHIGHDNVGEDDGTSDEDDTAFDTAINYSAHVSCSSCFASCAFPFFTQCSVVVNMVLTVGSRGVAEEYL